MGIKILPAVLAGQRSTFRRRIDLARQLSTAIHIDIMDGLFVTSRSITQKTLASFSPLPRAELHLMVQRPIGWLKVVKRLRIPSVVVHVELGSQLRPAIKLFQSEGIRVSLAINPTTALSSLARHLPFRRVVIMSVHPGRYGAPFQQQTINRVAQLRRRWPKLTIAVDGGMNAQTIPLVIAAGAQEVVVGSDIMRNKHPKAEWDRLRRLTRS